MYPAYRHAAARLYHTADFIHYIFICGNTATTQPICTPMAVYITYILLAWPRVSSSQQGGVKVATLGCWRHKKGGVVTSVVYH